MGGGGWGTGSSENKANLAQLGLELGLSLATIIAFNYSCEYATMFWFLYNIVKYCLNMWW